MSEERILIVDDEISILNVMSTLLKTKGYEVLSATDGNEAIEVLMTNENLDLIISDIRMNSMGGMDLMKRVRSDRPEISVIMLTAFATVETAIETMKMGAFDYVTKPFKVDELLVTIEHALAYKKALTENRNLKTQFRAQYRLENIIAESSAMKDVCSLIERVAPTDTTILIEGESGTGKKLIAKTVHAQSIRKDAGFMSINCASLPEPLLEAEIFGYEKNALKGVSANRKGLLEAVNGGTLFLEEISSMPINMQGRLLKVLQVKEVQKPRENNKVPFHARIIATTNLPIQNEIKAGRFREDLCTSLSRLPLKIPPLRERKEDIIPLVNHFLAKEFGEEGEMPSIAHDVYDVLEKYSWPGNVSEVQNVIKHAVTLANGNTITIDFLPAKFITVTNKTGSGLEVSNDEYYQFHSLKEFLRSKEKDYMKQVVSVFGGNKEKAADTLKISVSTLYRKLNE